MNRRSIVFLLCVLTIVFINGGCQFQNGNNGLKEIHSEFYQKLSDKTITRIKLVGDSITAGNGAAGFSIPADGRVIFDNGEEVFQEAEYTSNSWANSFRKYIDSSNFGNIDFVNAGIGGKNSAWVLTNMDYILDEKEDVVFVMLGTNDRWGGVFWNMKKILEVY